MRMSAASFCLTRMDSEVMAERPFWEMLVYPAAEPSVMSVMWMAEWPKRSRRYSGSNISRPSLVPRNTRPSGDMKLLPKVKCLPMTLSACM